MRRIIPTLLAVSLLAAGCASPERIGREPTRTTTVLRGGAIMMDKDPESTTAVIPASPDEVWKALFDAYEAVGIQVEHADTQNRIMGNRQFRIRRSLGDARASEYFDCGQTVSGMPAADAYRIQATVTTQVVPAEGGTQLVTAVGAKGRALQGTSTGEVRCATTGRLEEQLRDLTILAMQDGGQ